MAGRMSEPSGQGNYAPHVARPPARERGERADGVSKGRARIPAAEELLRGSRSDAVDDAPEAAPGRLRAVPDGWAEGPVGPATGPASRRSSGRERHEEKITVYISSGELVDLERARLTLRAGHGLAVDRGRLVREAVAVVLADLELRGEESTLVRRLRSLE